MENILKGMQFEVVLQLIQITVIILGLILFWFRVHRGQKESRTGSFLLSLSERWKTIEEHRHNINENEIKTNYHLLAPVLSELLKNRCKGDLAALAKAFLFSKEDLTTTNRKKLFELIAKEYADIDSMINLYEEEYIAGRHLRLVSRKLWRYWEYHIKDFFESSKMRNYWHLRLKVGITYPPFVQFVEKKYLNRPAKF